MVKNVDADSSLVEEKVSSNNSQKNDKKAKKKKQQECLFNLEDLLPIEVQLLIQDETL